MKNIVKNCYWQSLLFLAALEFIWLWGFCRFYVGPNEMAIITAKNGEPLEPGQILAREGQKGIREEPLGEGRHFLNPIFYEREIVPVIIIEPGKVGVVTSKVGDKAARGRIHCRARPEGNLAQCARTGQIPHEPVWLQH